MLYEVITDWPQPFTAEQGKMARQLHDVVQNQSWIKEVVAASGGVGTGPASIWIFWLENYAALVITSYSIHYTKLYEPRFKRKVAACNATERNSFADSAYRLRLRSIGRLAGRLENS